MKPSFLSKETESFLAWKVQMQAFLDLKVLDKPDLEQSTRINYIVLHVDVNILKDISIDGRSTVTSVFEALEKEWKKSRRPDNPTKAFFGVECTANIRQTVNSLSEFGSYFNASDTVIRQRFIEILPSRISSLAYLELARKPNISTAELVSLLENIPVDDAFTVAASSQMKHSTKSSSTEMSSRRCFKCGSINHLRNSCRLPDTVRCFKCSGNHLQRVCGNVDKGFFNSGNSGRR